MYKTLPTITMIAAATALAACGNVSRSVAPDGSRAGELVWPQPVDATPMHRGGTFPSVVQVRGVQPGINKQQIAALIGYPHFSEGIWGVREWNYLFNFRQEGSDEVTVCQFKILFDEQKLARSTYWKPEACAALLDAKPDLDQAIAATPVHTQVLSADALFAFDRFALSDIRPEGLEQLHRLANELVDMEDPSLNISVRGYTDRLGAVGYNRALSEKRAQTIRTYLIEQGVPADRIEAEGRGEDEPVTECAHSSHTTLIACLAPNRRVEMTTTRPN